MKSTFTLSQAISKLCAVLCVMLMFPVTALADAFMPYKQTFITTAYYSPLPDQQNYVTGSYYGDTRLNGNGTNGASGAEVFPGMLAAPKSYPFGFKIDIPGIGVSEVQDRGGAIVNAGERGQAHDRLDIWMGAGDVGLKRALSWGKRTVTATVYGVRPELAVTSTLENWDSGEIELVKYWKHNAPSGSTMVAKLFPNDLWFGQQSEKVKEMQQLLADMGYFFDSVDGDFDDATARAVYHFQRDNDIVYDWSELGAGHFGPHTRVTMESAKELLENGEYVNQTASLEKIQAYDDLSEDFTAFTAELYLGSSGDAVTELQEELAALGYLRVEPTGHFGQVTENALKRFQMKMGIVSSMNSHGAGVVGPMTRAALNGIFDERIEAKGMIAAKRIEMNDAPVLLASVEDVSDVSDETISEVVVEEVEESEGAGETEEIVEEPTVEIIEIVEEPEVLTYGSRGSDVKDLQSRLRDLGYFHSGFLTTYFGEKTEDALIAFQIEYGVVESADDELAGVLTDETKSLLF